MRLRPPIRRGDMASFGNSDIVAIIDGEFGQHLPVACQEIVAALARGARVFGAASMGALRSVELRNAGMKGAGWVYQQYLTGAITSDEEVALTYAPYDFEPLTIPLVNIRYWLSLIDLEHLIGVSHDEALAVSRKIHFTERTPEALEIALDSTFGSGVTKHLLSFTGDKIPDIKREDARLLLHSLSSP